MSGIEIALMAGSAVMSAVGTVMGGAQANAAAKFQAKQLEQRAITEKAIASRKASEQDYQRRLALSRAQVVGAASGGGRDYNLEGDLEEEGLYRQMTAVWEGDERARGLEMQADAARFQGKQAQRASWFAAGTDLMSSGASMYGKYGGSPAASGAKAGGSALKRLG